ncbi:hypothetical protein MTO96_023848 [Rhipicephalus appendiculatus]
MVHSSSVFQNFQTQRMRQAICICIVLGLMIAVAMCDDHDIAPFSFYFTSSGGCVVNGHVFENGSVVPTPSYLGCVVILCVGYDEKLLVYGCPKPKCLDPVVDKPAFDHVAYTFCCRFDE